MTRSRIISVLTGVALIALIAWVANNTHFVDTTVPMPPKGEALTNPFYAVQRFAEALGARTAWDRVMVMPPTDSVIILSSWTWDLSTARREGFERWVESGGRLVVDSMLSGNTDEFERWSGITQRYYESSDSEADAEYPEQGCSTFQEEHDGKVSGPPPTPYSLCGLDRLSFLSSDKNVEWALRDASRVRQAMRVQVGRGRVTVINGAPFRGRQLFAGDHGWLFVAATQMRRGDDVHFLSEDDHPSLLALLWQYGAPVVTLSLALLALVLWRAGVRFGPLVAPPAESRRSLAEQILGTGQFALRHGSGDALHAATVRALDEAGQRRIPGYARLSVNRRAAALEHRIGVDGHALAAAVHHGKTRRSHELRNAIALVEATRRQLLIEHGRTSDGTH